MSIELFELVNTAGAAVAKLSDESTAAFDAAYIAAKIRDELLTVSIEAAHAADTVHATETDTENACAAHEAAMAAIDESNLAFAHANRVLVCAMLVELAVNGVPTYPAACATLLEQHELLHLQFKGAVEMLNSTHPSVVTLLESHPIFENRFTAAMVVFRIIASV